MCQSCDGAEAKPGPGRCVPDEAVSPVSRLHRLTRDAKGVLVAHLADRDEPVTDVRVRRCFPWSLADSLISLLDADGKELVLLETLEPLPADTRELIQEELRDKFFAPKILKVLSFGELFGIVTLSARTDRGDVTFQLRSRDDVRVLSPTQCVIKDVDGNLYEVPDLTQLDIESQRRLDAFF